MTELLRTPDSSLQSLLADLTRLGVRLEIRGDRIAFAPRQRVRGELLVRLRTHKQELLQLLTGTVEEKEEGEKIRDDRPVPSSLTAYPPSLNVSVIICCHNQGQFLESAILSAVNQTHAPYEIVVVDDGSTDRTSQVAKFFAVQGVRYLRVHYENAHQAKRAGLEVTSGEFVLFLDADNILNRDYVERALRLFESPRVGVTYGDAWSFGDSEQRTDRPATLTQADIARGLLDDASALIRRHALVVADPWSRTLPPKGLDQQWLYRRLAEAGWEFRKHGAVLFDRRHPAQRRAVLTSYFERNLLALEEVTLFIPLSGRLWAWQELSRYLERQGWPHAQVRLVLCDTSQNPAFTSQVREWIASCDYADVRQLQFAAARPGLADELRSMAGGNLQRVNEAMCRIYNRLRQVVDTDYCWVLEDDVIPPDDVLERLMRAVGPDVATVSAPYRSRHDGRYLIWDRDHGNGGVHRIERPETGVRRPEANRIPVSFPSSLIQEIRGSGFGCLLVRTEVLKQHVFCLPPGELWYDPHFFRSIGDNWRRLVDWSCECRHLSPESGVRSPEQLTSSLQPLASSLISVLTAWYHGERWREQLEQTLTAQTHANWECVVIADGCEAPEFDDPRFRVFTQPHGGISAALNHAFAQSRGEFITWLDQDDRLEPHALQRMLSSLKEHSDWGAVKAPQAYHWPDGRITVEDFRPETGGFHRQRMLQDQLLGHPVLVRRECWPTWNTEFNFAADADWGLRLSEQTAVGYLHGEPLYRWMLHGENPSLKEHIAQTNDHQRAIRSARRRRRQDPTVAIVLPSLGITGGIRIALELARRLPALGIRTCVVEPAGRWARPLAESDGDPFGRVLPTKQPVFPQSPESGGRNRQGDCRPTSASFSLSSPVSGLDISHIPVWDRIPQPVDFAIATSWDLPHFVLEHQQRGDGHAGWLVQDWEAGWWPQNVTSDPGIDRIITVSEELQTRLKTEWGKQAQRITSGYDPLQFPSPGLRTKPDRPKVLIPWRDERRKNPEGTLALMRAIRERLGWEVVVLSGNAPPRRLLEFAECFRINPPQEELYRVYRECTHYATRSRREGSSVTCIEALSQGTVPVVQTLGTEYLDRPQAEVRRLKEADNGASPSSSYSLQPPVSGLVERPQAEDRRLKESDSGASPSSSYSLQPPVSGLLGAGIRLPLDATEEDYLDGLQRCWDEWDERSAECLRAAEPLTWDHVLPQCAEHIRQWARDIY